MQSVLFSSVSEWQLRSADLTMGLTQELEDLEHNSWLETLLPQPLTGARQSLSIPDSPLLVAILLATVIVGAQLLPLLFPLLKLSPAARGKLESDEMCGITTRGQVTRWHY